MELADSCDKISVTLRNAYKTYDGKNYVLRGLNMQVKEGTIYGLLGPSGCGKSTLLNAIIGLLGLDGGVVEISLKQKNELGFMPQAISLYEQLTVTELLTYYGTMYGMSNKRIVEQIDLMFKILELPYRNRCIPELSGGQKRRVSLAIALLHDPKLLILDEPTVGVDSVLRQRIWDFLMEWCHSSRTIIITTHYIEEIKQAHTVGLMREGVMLCEKSPQLLMLDCNTNYIEEAFLKLSQAQSVTDFNNKPPITKKQPIYSSLSNVRQTFSSARFNAEIRKNIIYLWRNLSVAIFILWLPSVSLALFNFTVGRNPEGLNFAFINDEVSSGSQFCNSYMQRRHITCEINYISCYYLKIMEEKNINLIEYNNLSDALNQMNYTHIWGVMYFSPYFSSALSQRFNEPLIVDDEIVHNSSISVYMDKSNKIIKEFLKNSLRESLLSLAKDIYRACNLSIKLVEVPLEFQKPIFGKEKPDFREFFGPALISIVMFGMPLTFGTAIIIEEKNSGATSRSLVAGTSLFEILAAHGTVQVLVQLVHTISCSVLLYGILEYPFQQPYLAMLLLLLQGCAGIAYAFTLSVSFSSITAVATIGTGTMLICMMIGGLLWPIEAIHPSLKFFSWVAPSTLPSYSLRNLTLRGWSFTHKDVYIGFVTCIMWIIVFGMYTYIYVKHKKNKVFISNKVV